jgi:hypothetical protein
LPLDPHSLPKDADTLKKIIVDLAEQLDRESSEKNKYAEMIRELLEAQRARKSEKLSVEQSGLFEELWRKTRPEADSEETLPEAPASAEKKRAARRPLARHVTRERIVHDLPEAADSLSPPVLSCLDDQRPRHSRSRHPGSERREEVAGSGRGEPAAERDGRRSEP